MDCFDIGIGVIQYQSSHLYIGPTTLKIPDIELLNLQYWSTGKGYIVSNIKNLLHQRFLHYIIIIIESRQKKSILKIELQYWRSYSELGRIKFWYWTLTYYLILKFQLQYQRGNFYIKGMGPPMYVTMHWLTWGTYSVRRGLMHSRNTSTVRGLFHFTEVRFSINSSLLVLYCHVLPCASGTWRYMAVQESVK